MVPPDIGCKVRGFYFFSHMLHHNVNRMHARSRSVKGIPNNSIIIFFFCKLWLGANINNVGGIYVPIASKPSVRGFIPLQAHLRLFSVHNLQLSASLSNTIKFPFILNTHILYNPIDIKVKV